MQMLKNCQYFFLEKSKVIGTVLPYCEKMCAVCISSFMILISSLSGRATLILIKEDLCCDKYRLERSKFSLFKNKATTLF